MYIEFEAYHTCNLKGSRNDILANSPYKSDLNKEQWLGQGYYFWTDSAYFAYIWGNKYPKGYAITKYTIRINRNDFLDLVGNVKDQLVFLELIKKYAKKIGEELGSQESARKITISKVLDHCRCSEEHFQFKAIKAMDYASKSSRQYPFLENGHETMLIPSRQQLYLSDIDSFVASKKLFCISQNGKKTSF